MDLYAQIFTRKSTRNFDPTPLSAEALSQLDRFIGTVKPLIASSKITHKIVPFALVKGLGLPKAPHYILISGADQPLKNTCAGFIYQFAELYLYSQGYATRWIGSAKSKHPDKESIIGIAFGRPATAEKRDLSDFNRKHISEIAEGNDTRLDAVRLAPSGLNKQPWYFIVDGDVIHTYYKKSIGGIPSLFYKLTALDAGIALCHLAVASEHIGKPFTFNPNRPNTQPAPKGFVYLGTVE